MTDCAAGLTDEPEGISLFQSELVRLVEQEMVRPIDPVRLERPAPPDAGQPDHLPRGVSAEAHQAAALEVVAVIEFTHFRDATPADTLPELAALHDLAGVVEAHPPEHGVPGHHHRRATGLQVVVDSVVGAGRPVFAVPVDADCFVPLQHGGIPVQIMVGDHVIFVSMAVQP